MRGYEQGVGQGADRVWDGVWGGGWWAVGRQWVVGGGWWAVGGGRWEDDLLEEALGEPKRGPKRGLGGMRQGSRGLDQAGAQCCEM